MNIKYKGKDLEIKIYSPSYRRFDALTTHKIFNEVIYVVDEIDYPKYKDVEKIKIKNEIQGNVARVRNYILDELPGDIKIIVDDDYEGFGYFEDLQMKGVKGDDLDDLIKKMVVQALDCEVKLFGVNLADDKMFYREYSPFSLSAVVLGPFTGVIMEDNDIRYDERIPLKEDYDLSLQHLNKFRKVLRFNKYFYKVKQSKNIGGCANMRNAKEEEKQFNILQRKWGSKIVKEDRKSSKKRKILDYNPVISVPIRGI